MKKRDAIRWWWGNLRNRASRLRVWFWHGRAGLAYRDAKVDEAKRQMILGFPSPAERTERHRWPRDYPDG
jgi:hypothetical protein